MGAKKGPEKVRTEKLTTAQISDGTIRNISKRNLKAFLMPLQTLRKKL
jgi:hypothetical protein